MLAQHLAGSLQVAVVADHGRQAVVLDLNAAGGVEKDVAGAVSEAVTSEVVTIAPALIIGFAGRPVPGSRLIALNASPLGSAPTRARTASSP